MTMNRLHAALLIGAALFAGTTAAQQLAASAPAIELPLFAVEIRTGAKWDLARPAQEQPFFREHSANLKRLRDAGALVMGARYGDKGLVVLAAPSEVAARAMLDEDPSFKAEIFRYEVNAMNVFYPGHLQRRRP